MALFLPEITETGGGETEKGPMGGVDFFEETKDVMGGPLGDLGGGAVFGEEIKQESAFGTTKTGLFHVTAQGVVVVFVVVVFVFVVGVCGVRARRFCGLTCGATNLG